MTSREAYDSDPTFRALVDVWVTERRCPLVLKDRCLELEMLDAAACAEWAATEPERSAHGGGTCGPSPATSHHGWFWYFAGTRVMKRADRQCQTIARGSVPDAAIAKAGTVAGL